MKHYFLNFLFALFLFTSTAKAQAPASGWRLGFGVDPGIPTSKAFQYALGGDIRLQNQFSNRIAGTVTAGFSHYFEKDHYADFPQYSSPFNVIPVKAGIKFFLADNLYAGGEAGAGFGMEEWGTSFLWSPSLGLAFASGIDLSVKYEDYTRHSATKDIALRLAYGFTTRKLAPHRNQNMPDGWQLEVSIDPGLLTNNVENFTMGAGVTLKKRLTGNLEAVASTGITHYFGNYLHYFSNYYYDHPGALPSSTALVFITQAERNVIPVEAGLRLYAGNHFYLQAQAGAAFGLNGTATFMYTPSLGLSFSNGVDIGLKYDSYHSSQLPDVLSLKLGYNFKLH
jgi:hypothetical protein